jgi:CBS domain-containing protein
VLESARKIHPEGVAVKLNDSVALTLQHKGSEIHSISPDSTVYEALEKMAEQDIGALVVMKGTDLVGIFSERDYARQVILKGRFSRETKVHEVMSSPVRTVSSKTTIDDCMRLMTTGRCRHMPVVDGEKLVGVVSIGDLVNHIITVQDFTIHQLEAYISGKYPA